MKKILILLILSFSLLNANNSFKIHVASCDLEIPDRYKLKEFTPPYNFNFTHLESKGKDWISNDNLFLRHNINIYFKENYPQKDKGLYIDKWREIMPLFSNIKSKKLEIFRFKDQEVEMNKKGAYQEVAKEFSRQANVVIILGGNFIIHIDETDKYIDEIYNMVKGCN